MTVKTPLMNLTAQHTGITKNHRKIIEHVVKLLNIFFRACEFSSGTCAWSAAAGNEFFITTGVIPSGPPDHTPPGMVTGSAGKYLYVTADSSNANKIVSQWFLYFPIIY